MSSPLQKRLYELQSKFTDLDMALERQDHVRATRETRIETIDHEEQQLKTIVDRDQKRIASLESRVDNLERMLQREYDQRESMERSFRSALTSAVSEMKQCVQESVRNERLDREQAVDRLAVLLEKHTQLFQRSLDVGESFSPSRGGSGGGGGLNASFSPNRSRGY